MVVPAKLARLLLGGACLLAAQTQAAAQSLPDPGPAPSAPQALSQTPDAPASDSAPLASAGGPNAGLAPSPAAVSGTSQALSVSAQALSGTARALSASAQAASATAESQDLPLLPPRPNPPKVEKAVPWEYFTVVTLLSAPFSVLWSGLVLGAAESIAQRRFPPRVGSSDYLVVGAVAGAASVGIGLFSLNWGGHPAPSPWTDNAAAASSAPVAVSTSAQDRPHE